MTQTQTRDPVLWALAEEQTEAVSARARARGVVVPDLAVEVTEAVYAQLLRSERDQATRSATPSSTPSRPDTAPAVSDTIAPLPFPALSAMQMRDRFGDGFDARFPGGKWDAMTPADHGAALAELNAAKFTCEHCQDGGIQRLPPEEVEPGRFYLVPSARGDRMVPQFRGVAEQTVLAHCYRCPPAVQRARNLIGLTQFDIDESTFNHYQPGNSKALRTAKFSTLRWTTREDTYPFLVLRGPVGVGKSHLAKAAALHLSEHGWPVRFVTARALLDHIKRSFDEQGPRTDHVLELYRSAGVLILDDFGAEYATEWAARELEALIFDRYERHALTLLTTNVAPAELQEHQRDDHGRLLSRLQDVSRVTVVEIEAEDYRARSRA